MPGVRVGCLCDIDELLERDDLDAISIAIPDHWHALMTIWGCQADKDVYVDKPCSFTLWEGRKRLAQRNGRSFGGAPAAGL